jgi:hypothetical protein
VNEQVPPAAGRMLGTGTCVGGTEELRTAVRHYRAFANPLADFSRET